MGAHQLLLLASYAAACLAFDNMNGEYLTTRTPGNIAFTAPVLCFTAVPLTTPGKYLTAAPHCCCPSLLLSLTAAAPHRCSPVGCRG